MEAARQLQLPTWDTHGPTRRGRHDAERTVKTSVSNPGTWDLGVRNEVRCADDNDGCCSVTIRRVRREIGRRRESNLEGGDLSKSTQNPNDSWKRMNTIASLDPAVRSIRTIVTRRNGPDDLCGKKKLEGVEGMESRLELMGGPWI